MIKSILGGKSKNLCDVAYLLTLPLDKTLEGYGYLRVLINAKPNTTYTFSRENANQINIGTTYLAISAYDDYQHNHWLNHQVSLSSCNKSVTLTTNSDGKLWIMFSGDVYYKYWQKNLNPFGYIQLELGSTATEYVPHELTSYKSIMKVSDVCQLVDKSKFTASGTINGITWVSNGDGSITLNGTCTNGFALNPFNQQIPVDQTHFYYSSPYVSINYGGGIDGTYETGHIGFVKSSKFPTKFNTVFYIWIDKDKSFSNVTTFINIDDLTEMFGAGNEPKTVAEFKAKFPNDYYPYSPGCFVTSFDERMPCKTKNLFDIPLIEGYPSDKNYGAGTLRTFTIGTYVVGMARSNNYEPSNVTNFNVSKNSISLKPQSSGYGINVPFILTVGQTYTISCIADNNFYPGIGISYYKEDGTFITYTEVETITNNPIKLFTVPENTYYTVITFYGRSGHSYMFSNIQLEKGTTATDYVPYGYV